VSQVVAPDTAHVSVHQYGQVEKIATDLDIREIADPDVIRPHHHESLHPVGVAAKDVGLFVVRTRLLAGRVTMPSSCIKRNTSLRMTVQPSRRTWAIRRRDPYLVRRETLTVDDLAHLRASIFCPCGLREY
jgi:hypothetical protein